jgi:NTE family protein
MQGRVVHPSYYDYIHHIERSDQKRQGIALCLSGGGFRAALFHLGALRRLNELGILKQVDVVSTVSGGSIFAGLLARAIIKRRGWPSPDHWNSDLADLRTPTLLKHWFWNLSGSSSAELLERYYDRHLTGGMRLDQLPLKPEFRFCATVLEYAWLWTFSKQMIGEEPSVAGSLRVRHGPKWTVAKAIAASSCFPPFFGPMVLMLKKEDIAEPHFKETTLRLTDGGVLDNFGLEYVRMKYKWIIVSDGGAPLRIPKSNFALPNLLPNARSLNEISAIALAQSSAIRKRWLIEDLRREGAVENGFRGTYFGIASAPKAYREDEKEEPQGYSRELAEERISQIRTDFDHFTTAEQQILENHGYFLADAAANRWLSELIPDELPDKDRDPRSPNPQWAPDAGRENDILAELAQSHKRKIRLWRRG